MLENTLFTWYFYERRVQKWLSVWPVISGVCSMQDCLLTKNHKISLEIVSWQEKFAICTLWSCNLCAATFQDIRLYMEFSDLSQYYLIPSICSSKASLTLLSNVMKFCRRRTIFAFTSRQNPVSSSNVTHIICNNKIDGCKGKSCMIMSKVFKTRTTMKIVN